MQTIKCDLSASKRNPSIHPCFITTYLQPITPSLSHLFSMFVQPFYSQTSFNWAQRCSALLPTNPGVVSLFPSARLHFLLSLIQNVHFACTTYRDASTTCVSVLTLKSCSSSNHRVRKYPALVFRWRATLPAAFSVRFVAYVIVVSIGG